VSYRCPKTDNVFFLPWLLARGIEVDAVLNHAALLHVLDVEQVRFIIRQGCDIQKHRVTDPRFGDYLSRSLQDALETIHGVGPILDAVLERHGAVTEAARLIFGRHDAMATIIAEYTCVCYDLEQERLKEVLSYLEIKENRQRCLRLAQESRGANAASQYELGMCYRDGTGISRNLKSAIHWFEESHRNGNKDAAFVLGEMYRKTSALIVTDGESDSDDETEIRDTELAIHWHTLSLRNGEPKSLEPLLHCSSKANHELWDEVVAFGASIGNELCRAHQTQNPNFILHQCHQWLYGDTRSTVDRSIPKSPLIAKQMFVEYVNACDAKGAKCKITAGVFQDVLRGMSRESVTHQLGIATWSRDGVAHSCGFPDALQKVILDYVFAADSQIIHKGVLGEYIIRL
jgi:hypothetical protein